VTRLETVTALLLTKAALVRFLLILRLIIRLPPVAIKVSRRSTAMASLGSL
jgi:hypothetical protein